VRLICDYEGHYGDEESKDKPYYRNDVGSCAFTDRNFSELILVFRVLLWWELRGFFELIYILIDGYQRLGATCCLHLQGDVTPCRVRRWIHEVTHKIWYQPIRIHYVA
jgi:hypothetical protein